MRKVPTPEEVRELLDYDPSTGRLTWKRRPARMFSDAKGGRDHGAMVWNSRWAGKPALDCLCGTTGYKVGAIFFTGHRAHRVAWCLHTGNWPVGEIDHINGDRTDNRIDNLREVTPSENRMNSKRRTDNPSGVTGVYWWPKCGKWRVQIKARNKRYHIGMFDTKEQAVAARKEAEERLGFHENHGRAA